LDQSMVLSTLLVLVLTTVLTVPLVAVAAAARI
jgi:hypothetical protein